MEWLQQYSEFIEPYTEYLDWFTAVTFYIIGILAVAFASEKKWTKENNIRRVSYLIALPLFCAIISLSSVLSDFYTSASIIVVFSLTLVKSAVGAIVYIEIILTLTKPSFSWTGRRHFVTFVFLMIILLSIEYSYYYFK